MKAHAPAFACFLFAATAAIADIQLSDPLFKENAVYDYLIISANDNGILKQAQRLAETKWEKGLKTCITNVDSITSVFEGKDAPHKIRNFLKMAYSEWRITWVLIMGDLELVPIRKVSTGGLYFPYDTLSIASDVYYACLDGEWDTDNDGIFGNERTTTSYSVSCKFEDGANGISCSVDNEPGLDLWYDVYLGRLPASDGKEAKIMVDKILEYRTTPRSEKYADDMVMLAAQIHSLWTGYGNDIEVDDATYYWHYKVKPFFDQASAFSAMSIDELYEDRVLDDGSVVNDSIEITYDKVSEYLSRGYNMVFFTFHGNPRGIRICSFPDSAPKDDYDYGRLQQLKSDYLSNIMSISCSIMKMIPDSQTCFAKEFLINPSGGGVSYTGASGIDYFNIRGRHYSRAVEYLARKKINRISKAFQLSNVKEFCRHNMFVHQYWGDPELELWTKSASQTFNLQLDASMKYGSYRVTVSPALDSVLVCLYKKDEVFLRGYTTRGMIEFPVADGSVENIKVTASYHNYIPGTGMINERPNALRDRDGALGMPNVFVVTSGSKTRIAFAGMHGGLRAQTLSLSGRIIEKFETVESNVVWTMPALPNGIYIIKTQSGTKNYTERFVIRR
jgi:hypothetical protein